MKRIPWPVAVLLLLASLGFAYYRVAPNRGPDGGIHRSGPPQAPTGTGPTPEQLKRWAAGAEAAEKRRLADVEKYRTKKREAAAPAAATPKGGE